MEAVDRLNRLMGRDTIRPARVGFTHARRMQSARRSRRYNTDWRELLTVAQMTARPQHPLVASTTRRTVSTPATKPTTAIEVPLPFFSFIPLPPNVPPARGRQTRNRRRIHHF